MGIRHERIDLRTTLVQEDFRKYARTGPMSDEGSWASAMWDRIQSFSCAYDGIAGDVLAMERLGGQTYDAEFHALVRQRQWAALAERILNHYAVSEEAMAPLLAAASFRDCGREAVLQRIIDQLRPFEGSPQPVAMFLLNARNSPRNSDDAMAAVQRTHALLCALPGRRSVRFPHRTTGRNADSRSFPP